MKAGGPLPCSVKCALAWLWLLALSAASAADDWQAALDRMPLPNGIERLDRTNCVHVMLKAFTSNDVVKALIFLPGATDEFYMFGRAEVPVSSAPVTLAQAIAALTNHTRIRATFRSPFLLLHTDTDPVEPKIAADNQRTREHLARMTFASNVHFDDNDWDFVQPLLKKRLKMDIQPWRYSQGSVHFYRSAFTGWNLTAWETLEAVALASQTRITVERKAFLGLSRTIIRFECDIRGGN